MKVCAIVSGLVALALVLVLGASQVAMAQAPAPGWVKVGDGWVPPTHPLAQPFNTTPAPYGLTQPVPVHFQGTVFEAGRVYQGPYPTQQFLVLGTTRSTSGRTVVTFEWLTVGWNIPKGSVNAQFADELHGFVVVPEEPAQEQ